MEKVLPGFFQAVGVYGGPGGVLQGYVATVPEIGSTGMRSVLALLGGGLGLLERPHRLA